MITGLAHTALHVADVDAATAWYRDVLGFEVLSPPYRMEGDAIARDMGELVPAPVVVKASIVGVDDGSDRVIEVIEYPSVDRVSRFRPTSRASAIRTSACCATTSLRRAPSSKRAGCTSSSRASPTSRACAPRGSKTPGTTSSSSSRRSAGPTGPYYRQYP